MPDPAVSLIVATLNRVAELERLLASLDGQTVEHFEVIIVDQNPDDRLAGTLARHPKLNLVHLRCRPGASRARNVGLRAARGNIIGFPDDDCWYPENVLKVVTEWFASHPEFDGLFGVLRDENNRLTGPQWPSTPASVHGTHFGGPALPQRHSSLAEAQIASDGSTSALAPVCRPDTTPARTSTIFFVALHTVCECGTNPHSRFTIPIFMTLLESAKRRTPTPRAAVTSCGRMGTHFGSFSKCCYGPPAAPS